MIGSIVKIQETIFQVTEVLNDHRESLQKEFEYMITWANDKTLQAKKNQIFALESLHALHVKIFDHLNEISEAQFKLEACSVYYGVSFPELVDFVSRPLNRVESDIKDSLRDNYVTVPEKIQLLINEVESSKRYSENSDLFIKNLEKSLSGLNDHDLYLNHDAPVKPIKMAEFPTLPFEVLQKITLNSKTLNK